MRERGNNPTAALLRTVGEGVLHAHLVAAMSADWWSLLRWSRSAPELRRAVSAGLFPTDAAQISGV
jgi:hypothetical protein